MTTTLTTMVMTATHAYTLETLAERLGGTLEGDGQCRVRGIGPIDEATAEQITFIADERYARRWAASAAAAAVVSEGLDLGACDPRSRPLIRVRDAEIAIAALLDIFAPPPAVPDTGVHSTAWIDPSVDVPDDARIGPHVSVERDCVLGAGAVLHAGVRLYPGVRVGDGCTVHGNVVVSWGCTLGRRVVLHPNVSIGADGFGYRPAADGSGLVKIPHIGTVTLEDDVEIGAGSAVDRAKFGATVVGEGTRLDNFVQIAHNCRVGRHCVFAAYSGLAGSAVVGDWVMVGGGATISDHVHIGDGARIAARSGVMHDVPAGEAWGGLPAAPSRQTLRQWAIMRKLPDLFPRIVRLLDAGDQARRPESAPD